MIIYVCAWCDVIIIIASEQLLNGILLKHYNKIENFTAERK